MKSYESSARTIEEAIEAGLSELNAAISDVDVEILDEGSKGLFGLFGSRLAKVRLTLKEVEEDLLALTEDKPKARPAREPKAERPAREPRPKAEPKAAEPAVKETAEAAEAAPAEMPKPVQRKAPKTRQPKENKESGEAAERPAM